MRRWNGWGDDAVHAPLAAHALAFLRERVGASTPPRDATLEQACAGMAASRLPPHPDVSTQAADRLAASHGQSLGDWIALRFGQPGAVCDGVAWPESDDDVQALVDWARAAGARLLPCGGRTSVAGHLAPRAGDARPLLVLDLSRMRALRHFDPVAQLATFDAGVRGPDLEAQLRTHGCTLGHYPQSFEYASLGGWVATRSSGQQSLRYGRAEQWFAGARLVTPRGPWALPPLPASAAGPDLREWVLGSEGRLGVITEVTVRASRLPECERFVGVFLPDEERGQSLARELVQRRVPLSMLRLSLAAETDTTLRLAGHARAIGWLDRWLRWRGCGDGRSLLLLGLTGSAAQVRQAQAQAARLVRQHGGASTGTVLGRRWQAQRFAGVYLRNALWDAGYMVDTMETAVDWSRTAATVRAMEQAGRDALQAMGERCHAYTHLSHVYGSGSSVYTTFVLRVGPDAATSRARWWALKQAVSQAVVRSGGTISHQHGAGHDHAPWLAAEKGAVGHAALADLLRECDPDGLFDTGNLLEGPAGRDGGAARP
jgi:alkyldihydroxyacetonephosphate synthase